MKFHMLQSPWSEVRWVGRLLRHHWSDNERGCIITITVGDEGRVVRRLDSGDQREEQS